MVGIDHILRPYLDAPASRTTSIFAVTPTLALLPSITITTGPAAITSSVITSARAPLLTPDFLLENSRTLNSTSRGVIIGLAILAGLALLSTTILACVLHKRRRKRVVQVAVPHSDLPEWCEPLKPVQTTVQELPDRNKKPQMAQVDVVEVQQSPVATSRRGVRI